MVAYNHSLTGDPKPSSGLCKYQGYARDVQTFIVGPLSVFGTVSNIHGCFCFQKVDIFISVDIWPLLFPGTALYLTAMFFHLSPCSVNCINPIYNWTPIHSLWFLSVIFVCHMQAWCSERSNMDINREPPCICWDLNPGPLGSLQEQIILITEPSLPPHFYPLDI